DLKGKLLAVLKGHTDKINDAVFSPYGKWILTTSDDKRAIIWASPEIIIEKIKMKNLSIPELTKEDKKKFGIADFEL
ncbi:MAG TPA: WD40 repeat domain-containing protein, partial [Candidatus Kapabacteria bacterium]|nr:WD40 repeat domain-containing protein [Candidatus Kapabacteria bacterium]